MSIPEDIPLLLSHFFSLYAVQQIAPLVIIVVIPLIVLAAQPHIARLFRQLYMVLESLALALPWNWRPASSASGSVSDRGNKLKKRTVRSRAEQVAANGDVSGPSSVPYFDGYYPGLVNLSGSYCFMNSTIQAMASLSYLQPHIDMVFNKAESLASVVHTPVIDELRDLLGNLNTPTSSQMSIRPEDMITALSRYSNGKHNPLFSSRQHQDAQELFQLVSECIKREIAAVDKESYRDLGLASSTQGRSSRRPIGKSVFDGLTANRRSCRMCGYTEAVMHFGFDNWQLALPRAAYCTLDTLLQDYTRLEELDDCICRRCSMQATHDRLVYEAEKLTRAAAVADASSSKRRRAREARAMETRVKAALDEGRIEDDIKGLQMEKVFSRSSTKQAMIARPPPVLVLHLNRSIHYGGSDAARNNCRVAFNEFLDLTPYTTSGQLSTNPSHPISHMPSPPNTYPRYIYRLSAVVCHYGNHYAGHYVCFRRKPRPPSAGSRRWAPPRFTCPFGCTCEKCQRWGPVRDEWDVRNEGGLGSGGGWLMASDTHVKEVGIEQVLAEGSGAFMLFYERVVPYQPHHQQQQQHEHQDSYSKSSMRSAASSVPTLIPSYANGSGHGVERHPLPPMPQRYQSSPAQGSSSGVYSSTSPKSSEETLRPGMDALNSSSSVSASGDKSGSGETLNTGSDIELSTLSQEKGVVEEADKAQPEDTWAEEEDVPVRRRPIPRILMNVSTKKRARSISVPPMERTASSSTTATTASTMSTASSATVTSDNQPQIPNGVADTTATSTPPSPPASPRRPKHSPSNPSSPKKSKLKKSPPAPLDASESSPSAGPPSPPTPTTPTPTSPPSSPKKNRHGRAKRQAQEKERAPSTPPRPLSPARMVGLRA
ncbi:hypothetical protein EIP91_010941 [Steccherinum ochraceum]|uniref:ubiquitinyl hydrolase 1 n=1 Tax=Steccherinum ochraceum TaxID=92696 RepID=A0A4R0RBX9_9APHY|nr:hypothetical protein EIP91_010941 [Steccherinum ochraceum]